VNTPAEVVLPQLIAGVAYPTKVFLERGSKEEH